MNSRARISSVPKRIALAITSTLIFICLSCSGTPTQQLVEPEPRTYYESLDLSSPESAIQTFVDAFSRDDFPTVWLILDGSAQFTWAQQIRLLEFGALIQTANWEVIKMDISTFAKGLGEGEHSEADTGYVFDQFMLAARKHSAFLIDLTGPVEILSSEPYTTRQDDPAIDVTVKVEMIEEEVVFRMVQAPSGRWRVYKVFVPGGEDELLPWGIPPENDESAWAINDAGSMESGGVTIEIARIVVGYKDVIEELTGQDFSKANELTNWSEIEVVGELVFKVTNNAEVRADVSPEFGTVQINEEEIDFHDYYFWNLLIIGDMELRISPGETIIRGFWFGIKNSNPGEITEIIYRTSGPNNSNTNDDLGPDYEIVIPVENPEWQELPEELK